MKRYFVFFALGFVSFGLAACGGDDQGFAVGAADSGDSGGTGGGDANGAHDTGTADHANGDAHQDTGAGGGDSGADGATAPEGGADVTIPDATAGDGDAGTPPIEAGADVVTNDVVSSDVVTSEPDATTPDAAAPDAAEPDTGTGETGTPDAGTNDAPANDTGTTTGDAANDGGAGCSTEADCPVPSSPCVLPTCVDHQCGTTSVSSGTAIAAQVPNDCKKIVCDGAGSTQTINDDNDTPNDGNECTDDLCTAGVPTHPVLTGQGCAGGFCNANAVCVDCLVDSQCGADTTCAQRVCNGGTCGINYVPANTPIAAQTTGDCLSQVCDGAGNVQPINDDNDVPTSQNACAVAGCNGGAPTSTPKNAGTGCGNGVCDGSGHCVGCNAPADCLGTDDFCKARSCVDFICGVVFTAANTALATGQTAGDCTTQVCDGAGNVQGVAAPSDVPVDASDCTDNVCTGTTPSNPPFPPATACSGPAGAHLCDGAGACVACLSAANCPTPAGFPCVVATCTNGACGTASAPASTACSTPTCSNGLAQLTDQCDGAGNCVDAGTASCGAYVCGPSSCNTKCTGDPGCTGAGFSCDVDRGVCTDGPKCSDYCDAIGSACSGPNLQYTTRAECVASCTILFNDPGTNNGGDPIGCRITHAGLAAASASDAIVHCPHAGPNGGGVCGDNDCDTLCAVAVGACTGQNQAYASRDVCLAACGSFGDLAPYSPSPTAANTVACRMAYAVAATVDPASNCANVTAASPACH